LVGQLASEERAVKDVSIADAKALAEDIDADGVIVFDRGYGLRQSASYGRDKKRCNDMGQVMRDMRSLMDHFRMKIWSD